MDVMDCTIDVLNSEPGSYGPSPDEAFEECWSSHRPEVNSDQDTIPVLHFVLHEGMEE